MVWCGVVGVDSWPAGGARSPYCGAEGTNCQIVVGNEHRLIFVESIKIYTTKNTPTTQFLNGQNYQPKAHFG